MENVKCAICYDFDGTLCKGNMQDPLLEELGFSDVSKFWKDVDNFQKKTRWVEFYLGCILF